MMSGKSLIFIAVLILVLMVFLLTPREVSPDYSYFCEFINEYYENEIKWNLIIYLNADACLSCAEDMTTWVNLEKKLPEYNGILTIWAPPEDSFDVAYAMQLEGLETPIRIVDLSIIKSLGWQYRPTPIKVLLDKDCQPIYIIQASENIRQSRQAMKDLMAAVS